MIVRLSWPHGRAQAFYAIFHDVANVEFDRPLDVLSNGLGPHTPGLSEPAGCTLHSHTEFRQAASIVRNLCSAEGSRKVSLSDTCRIVSDTDESGA